MSNIKFFLHDDEEITGITTKRAHYSFYEYLVDSNGNIIKTFVDGKEYRAMFVDIPHKKKPSFEDEFEIHAATSTPTEYPFTEYGKTVTLSHKDDVKPAGFKSKSEWVADGNKLPDPDDVAKQMAKDLKDLVDQTYKDDPEFAKRVDAYRSKNTYVLIPILLGGIAIVLGAITIITVIGRHV